MALVVYRYNKSFYKNQLLTDTNNNDTSYFICDESKETALIKLHGTEKIDKCTRNVYDEGSLEISIKATGTLSGAQLACCPKMLEEF